MSCATARRREERRQICAAPPSRHPARPCTSAPLTAPPPTAPACTTQEIANDLFRFLRLEPWRVNTSQTRKAGGAVMRDSIENADEVASVLKGTVFEGQVDEEFASWRAKAAL